MLGMLNKACRIALWAIALACGIVSPQAVYGQGNIVLTGHDVEIHGGQSGWDLTALNYLRCAGTAEEIPAASYRIAVIGRGTPCGAWSTGGTIGPAGYPSVVNIDANLYTTVAQWTPVLSSGGTPLFDCIMVSSHSSGFGCLTPTLSNNLNVAQPLIQSLFNQGMDIWANTAGTSATYYDFLPTGFVTTGAPISASVFCATPAGATAGLTCAMTSGNQTHNTFPVGNFSPTLTVWEQECSVPTSCAGSTPTNRIVTLAAKNIRLGACATINDGLILCEVTPPPSTLTGNYTYTFTFTNNTAPPRPIQYLFTPSASGVTFNGSPPPMHSLALATPVLPGATSPPITVTITDATPGEFCFDMTFGDPNIDICCRLRHCVDLPECDCEQFTECSVVCIPGTGNYSLTFTLRNLIPPTTPGPSFGNINELHIFPLPIGSGVTANLADFYFANVPPFGLAGPFTTIISGAAPGRLCLRISIHFDGLECCSEIKCIDLPNCGPPTGHCIADIDDGSGTGTPDGGVTIDDLLYYLLLFDLGDPRADVDDGSGTGVPDGGVTIDDLLMYLWAFEAGGC